MAPNLVRLSGLAAMLEGVLWALWAGVEQSVGWGQPGSAAYERYELIYREVEGRFSYGKVIVGYYYPKTGHVTIIFPEGWSRYVERKIEEVFCK